MNEQNQEGDNIESLINLLESNDNKVRKKARELLVALGEQAVSPLDMVLKKSKIYKARWEAAKALDEIGDTRSIPALVKALEDQDRDVAWLAAEALMKFKMLAWPELLHALIKRGTDSVLLRHAAHHVFRRQKVNGYNLLLEDLKNALESDSVPENIPVAAFNILKKMESKSSK